MIKELAGMPPGVTGFEISGKVQAEDYRDVVLPAVEQAAANGDVRFLCPRSLKTAFCNH